MNQIFRKVSPLSYYFNNLLLHKRWSRFNIAYDFRPLPGIRTARDRQRSGRRWNSRQVLRMMGFTQSIGNKQSQTDANVAGAPALIEIIREESFSAAWSPLSNPARDGKRFIIIIIHASIHARCTHALSPLLRAMVTGEYVTCAYPGTSRGASALRTYMNIRYKQALYEDYVNSRIIYRDTGELTDVRADWPRPMQ